MLASTSAFLTNQGVDAAAAAVVAGAGAYLAATLSKIVPHRRLWRFAEPKDVVICAAASTSTRTEDGYHRPATGIGQVRALALIMPSLARAYKGIEVRNIRLSTDMPGDEHESDLIVLGGVKNNAVTQALLEKLGDVSAGKFPLRQVSAKIEWTVDGGKAHSYEGRIEKGEVVRDYGYVIQTDNPWCRGKSVIVLAGSHTYGTVVAARFFVSEMSRLSRWRERNFAAVVSADVRQGHVTEPSIEQFAHLTDIDVAL